MTLESSNSVPSQRRSVMLDIGDGNGTYANANSYLKARRSAAIELRRSKILVRVDNSIDKVNYELPDFSDVDGPIVPLPEPVVKRKSRSLPLKASSSLSPTRANFGKKTASFSSPQRPCHPPSARVDDVTSPMEEVLKTLESSGAGESDGTSCTHMMSSTSFAFNISQSSVLSKEYMDCEQGEHYDDDDATYETEYEEIEEESYRDEDEERETMDDAFYSADEWSVEYETEDEFFEETIHDHKVLEESIHHDEFFEETIHDHEVLEESAHQDEFFEESMHDEDSFEEEIAEEEFNQVRYDIIEEEYFSDEEEIIEEIIGEYDEGDYEEHSVKDDDDSYDEVIIEEEIIGDGDDGDFEEYIIEEYRSKCSESSLGTIDEEDYDSDCSTECNSAHKTNLAVKSQHEAHYCEEIYNGEEYEDIEEEESYHPYSTEFDDEFEESLGSCSVEEDCDVMDEESYYEEEIIPNFEVPVIPALEAWHKQQEELMTIVEQPPEEAPRTPREILMAVLAAAAMDFKLRKVPEDHKRNYTPLSASAACLGRLTKLDEWSIEAFGRAPAVRNKDEWRPTGAPIVFHQSISLRIATEAAAMGRVMRLKERVVTNYEEPKPSFFPGEGEEKVNVDELLDEKGRPVFRTSVLVPFHERVVRHKVLSKDWKVGILEASSQKAEGISVDNVTLPTARVPRFTKPLACSPVMSRDEIKDAIARGVAEGAWNRKYRLDRPQVQLRITNMCRCRYCENPNAYQTHAYKKLSQSLASS